MIIETKHNVGDKVWYRHHDNIIEGIVERIEVHASKIVSVDYEVRSDNGYRPSWKWMQENQIYKSEKELLEKEAK